MARITTKLIFKRIKTLFTGKIIGKNQESLGKFLAMLFVFSSSGVQKSYANPQLEAVSAGSATVSSSGTTTTINQSSDKAVIDWRSFNIAAGETTRFVQPSSSSITLNRINDTKVSTILGTLSANGNIVLLNPNGIMFGTGSQIDVNSIVASTSNISNSDFMSGNMNFSHDIAFTNGRFSNPKATITNQGTITAKEAGLVGLVAPNVVNKGIINARLGKVQLNGADSFTVDFYGDGLINLKLSDSVTRQLIDNSGTINANGGVIQMTAAAGKNVVSNLINVKGDLNATSVEQKNGKIIIKAENLNRSNVTITKNIDVSGEKIGGEVEISARDINITNTSEINANATNNGNGGKVSIAGENSTAFNGKITAKAGENGGNGGTIETSGKNALTSNGSIDASSKLGNKGQWLLSPSNITIRTTAGTGIVTVAAIESALNSGTDITITTATSGTKIGNIAISNTITKSSGVDSKLTLKAVGNISLASAANITSTSGKLDLKFTGASVAANDPGSITIGSSIDSNGGNIVIGEEGFNKTIRISGTGRTIDSKGGDISLFANTVNNAVKDGIYVAGTTISSGSGKLTVDSTVNNSAGTNAINVANSGRFLTTTGDISITGNITSASTSLTGARFQNNTDLSTVHSSNGGNIAIKGNANATAANSTVNGLVINQKAKISNEIQNNGSKGNILLEGNAVGQNGSKTYGINNAGSTTASIKSENNSQDKRSITVTGNASGGTSNTGILFSNFKIDAGKNDLTINAGLIDNRSAQTIATKGGAININAPIKFTQNFIVSSKDSDSGLGGNINFQGAIDGNKNLTVDAGTSGKATFNGAVGDTTRLVNLNVTSGGGVDFNKNVKAATIFANASESNGDIKIADGASLHTSAKSGNSIILAAGRNFINNSNSTALGLTGTSRSIVYSSNPENDVLGGIARPTKRYDKTFSSYSPTSVTEKGNVFLYSIAPSVVIKTDSKSKLYGEENPELTENVSGAIDGDILANLYNKGVLSTAADESSLAGNYAINTTSNISTLATTLGYKVVYQNGVLTVRNPATAKKITAGEVYKNFGVTENQIIYSATYKGLGKNNKNNFDLKFANKYPISDIYNDSFQSVKLESAGKIKQAILEDKNLINNKKNQIADLENKVNFDISKVGFSSEQEVEKYTVNPLGQVEENKKSNRLIPEKLSDNTSKSSTTS